MILVSMKKEDSILWYQTIILWACQLQVHRGLVPTPLWKTCYTKSLRKTSVNVQVRYVIVVQVRYVIVVYPKKKVCN